MRGIVSCFIITLCAAGVAAQDFVVFVPAAASAEGVGDSFFVTNVRVFNPDPEQTITVQIAYLERGADNTGASESSFDIGPRQGLALDDIVASVFGIAGAGGLRLRSDSEFYVTSRTFNTGGEEGTFGQFIVGQTPDQALETGILLQVRNDPMMTGRRSNVGFSNVNEQAVDVAVRVFDLGSGSLLGETQVDLAPLAVFQINNVFQRIGMGNMVVDNASVEFDASAPVLAYASVLDNTSDDPTYVLPFEDSGTSIDDNSPPDGTITTPSGDVTVATGEQVSFVGETSDPDGDDVTVEWDFGDGVTSSELEPTHTYSEAGSYTVTLTATDSNGASDPSPPSVTVTVEVESEATLAMVQAQIFTPSCALSGCHAGASPQQGMSLEEGEAYDNTVDVASNERPELDRIEPGDPESSYLWLKVTGDDSIVGSQMPLTGGPLSQDQLDLLESWITAGAPDN